MSILASTPFSSKLQGHHKSKKARAGKPWRAFGIHGSPNVTVSDPARVGSSRRSTSESSMSRCKTRTAAPSPPTRGQPQTPRGTAGCDALGQFRSRALVARGLERACEECIEKTRRATCKIGALTRRRSPRPILFPGPACRLQVEFQVGRLLPGERCPGGHSPDDPAPLFRGILGRQE